MFVLSIVKIHLFILLLITIFLDRSLIDAEDPECDIWNEFCAVAVELKNPRYRCIEKSVFYYEPQQQSWDKSRQLCSQKFYGSYWADLVELSDNRIESAKEMMSSLKDLQNEIELATSGVCCMRKAGETQARNECQWLSDGRPIDPKLYVLPQNSDKQCNVVLVKFANGKFTPSKVVNKNGVTPFPYLCAFNAPDNCKKTVTSIPTTSTTLPPKTTEHIDSQQTITSPVTKSEITTKPTNSSPIPTNLTCNHDGHYNGSHNISYWVPVLPKEWSRNDCPAGYKGTAEWFCENNSEFDISGPIITCQKEWMTNLTDKILKPDKPVLDTDEVLENSDELTKLLKEEDLTFFGELDSTIKIIEKLQYSIDMNQSKELSNATKFTNNIVESCSILLDKTIAWNNTRSDHKIKLASEILKYVQYSAFTLGCLKNNNTRSESRRIVEENIVMDTFTLDHENPIHFEVKEKDSSISIPAKIYSKENRPLQNCTEGTAIGAVFDKLSTYLSAHLNNSDHKINSNIVAFSYTNKTTTVPLPDGLKVKIVVKHNELLKFGDKIECVYWDFNQSVWSRDGCLFEPINSNREISICECDHLTNFAALMDVSGQEKPSKIKSVLTIVCSIISSISLLLTIGFLSLVRALRNRRSTITCNLCICLLIANILVAFGMDKTENDAICQTISALILYSLLASFSWMLMEGYHLYQMIVLVFSNIGHLRLIWLYAIGYGAPLIVFISALLGIGFDGGLRGDYFCWISSSSHPYRVWALAGPATFVILANCLIMFLALKAAFSAKVKKSEPNNISENSISQITASSVSTIAAKLSTKFSWMKGYISLVVLMGITWISYVFYIHEYGIWFSYVFIVMNGLQGFFIFTFQILLNEKARTVVHKHYRKRLQSRYFSSFYNKTNSTNMFASVRDKSIHATDKSTGCSNSSNGSNSNRVSVANNSQHVSHRRQSISIPRIRNASDSILT